MASAAKEHINICKAKAEEKVEKAGTRTKEEKKIAEERRKAKEARAKMELHEAKAKRAAEKFRCQAIQPLRPVPPPPLAFWNTKANNAIRKVHSSSQQAHVDWFGAFMRAHHLCHA